ncbi:hypothetical protein ACFV9W_03485 [Streptomyces sp. NPDC059897]|uniref:hypothetical protein n=1 Tax=Streptomyces sp. NPDC059897 TaxID=3346994 RepID=UPI0036643B08
MSDGSGHGAIALGALLGGQAADGVGITAAMWVGGGLALAALVATAEGRAPTTGRV